VAHFEPLQPGATTFAFVAINDGLTLGKWKDINEGYSKKENKLQKEKFERLILNEKKMPGKTGHFLILYNLNKFVSNLFKYIGFNSPNFTSYNTFFSSKQPVWSNVT